MDTLERTARRVHRRLSAARISPSVTFRCRPERRPFRSAEPALRESWAAVYGVAILVPGLFADPAAVAVAVPFIALGGGVLIAVTPTFDNTDGVIDLQGQDGSPAAKNFVPYQLNALNWMMTAFLGGYIWSIGYLLWRMGQRDVTGHAYNTISVRMLVAGLLAVVLFHIFRNWTGIEGYVLLLPLAAGLTPQWVMIWLLRWIQQKLQSADEKETDLSPKLIEGIDEMVRARLSEAGVDDAQGLASANPLRLAIQTPFTFSSVLDWTGQALLLVYAKPNKFRDLSERGVRTAYELVALPDDARNTIGTALGLDLGPIVGSLRVDPSYLRYAEIVRRMNALPGPA